MKRDRECWFDLQPDPDPEKLVFINEAGTSTKMARCGTPSQRQSTILHPKKLVTSLPPLDINQIKWEVLI